MNSKRFFANPYFLSYARLLRQLHQLIRAGTDETEQGETLRERMDEPAEDLTPEEVDCLNAISADFHTLAGPAPSIMPAPPDIRDRLKEVLDAREGQDFGKALHLLRKNEQFIDPAAMASFRGSIWSKAGENEIALDFFQRANELAPGNGGHASMGLDAVCRGKGD